MSRPVRDFVHLRMRSPYSMLEGALKIDETAKRAVRYRQPALAITDTNNLCGALEFCEKVTSEGVQPIIGVTLTIDLEGKKQPGQIHKDPDGRWSCWRKMKRAMACLLYTSPSPRDS